MRILVTGGVGYLGAGLVETLVQKPEVESIVVYDNLSKGNYNLFLGSQYAGKKIKFIYGDILDSRLLRNVLQKTDVVYHLAAKVTTPYANTDSHYFEQVNHWGTAELVYAAEDSGISKFIFVSSTAVYGNSETRVNENSATNPVSYYGLSKLRGEEQVKRLFQKIPAVILRTGNVYGYGRSMRFDSVINKFMFEAHFSKRITLNGNGNQIRPFIHINRVIDHLVSLFEADASSGIHNLVEHNLSILDIAGTLQEIYPELEHLFVNPQAIPPSLHVELPKNEPARDFKSDLLDFKNQFSFYSAH